MSDQESKVVGHTPGPWREGETWQNIIADDPIQPDDPWQIAMMADEVGYQEDPHVQARANARLIQAAPALLEACKQALAVLEEEHPGGGNIIDELRTVIVKAEGGGR